ncbi:MAG: DUF2267 domain-containing protein [Deltaproteobacteria bacterium]|nr:DUF2267 domain-containing protein [Deltaproteobacteria bacterium]
MMDRIDERILRQGMARRGLATEEGGRALRATLAVIGERLVDDEAHALASWLPSELATIVEDAEYDADFGTQELFVRVARRMKAPTGRALEDAEIVLATLGEVLGVERATRLARAMPETAAGLILGHREADLHAEVPPRSAARHAPRATTLASGRPGSLHPLYEGKPPAKS